MTDRFSECKIPKYLAVIQVWCFVVLYAVWSLPETILVRNVSLIIGALIGLYVIVKRRKVFLQKKSLPLWLIFLLLIWGTIHLYFFSGDFQQQWIEYTSIWKRVFLGFLFAIGLGQVIVCSTTDRQNNFWWIILFGLFTPVLIYNIKLLLQFSINTGLLRVNLPEYLQLFTISSRYYVPKSSYVAFVVPILGVALGALVMFKKSTKFSLATFLVYCIFIVSSFFSFFFYKDHYGKNILNGVLISSFLLLVSILIMARRKVILMLLILGLGMFIGLKNIEPALKIKNDFIASIDLTKNQNWKFQHFTGDPINEFGQAINYKYYERFAWASAAIHLVLDRPEGFGLIHGSFGRLAKLEWPDTDLSQSHSGWLDLALGIGIPGISLIWFAIILVLFYSITNVGIWQSFTFWVPFSLSVAWFLSELAQKVYFDQLIFLLVFSASLLLSNRDVIEEH